MGSSTFPQTLCMIFKLQIYIPKLRVIKKELHVRFQFENKPATQKECLSPEASFSRKLSFTFDLVHATLNKTLSPSVRPLPAVSTCRESTNTPVSNTFLIESRLDQFPTSKKYNLDARSFARRNLFFPSTSPTNSTRSTFTKLFQITSKWQFEWS